MCLLRREGAACRTSPGNHHLWDGIKFVLPWASIGISVFSVLLVIFVNIMYAVSKLRKENTIDALRDDTD